MKEAGKGNLLLPLGIGAGVLLLFMSMKKKQTETTDNTIDPAATLPVITAEETSVPQINPNPAPAYTKTVSPDASSGEEDDAHDEGEDDGSNNEDDTDDNDPDDTPIRSYSKSGSSSGGSYTPYQPASTINTNRPAQPLPTTVPATLPLLRTNMVNTKSLRFQSDQAKLFAKRMATKVNPYIIGNGKPKMGIPLPVNYRPGTATPAMQPIVISSQKPSVISSVPQVQVASKQTTIFPLRFGITNSYVKEVQKKLGVSSTGYFGTLTKAAIQKRFGVTEISEALYKQIITGKSVAPPAKKPIVIKHPVKKKIIKKPAVLLPKK